MAITFFSSPFGGRSELPGSVLGSGWNLEQRKGRARGFAVGPQTRGAAAGLTTGPTRLASSGQKMARKSKQEAAEKGGMRSGLHAQTSTRTTEMQPGEASACSLALIGDHLFRFSNRGGQWRRSHRKFKRRVPNLKSGKLSATLLPTCECGTRACTQNNFGPWYPHMQTPDSYRDINDCRPDRRLGRLPLRQVLFYFSPDSCLGPTPSPHARGICLFLFFFGPSLYFRLSLLSQGWKILQNPESSTHPAPEREVSLLLVWS